MSKLDEFNESISSLQHEVENLQAIEQAYKQLAKLVEDYDRVLANLNHATRDMTSTKGELQKQSSSVSEKLIEQKNVLETATAEQRKELEIKLKNLQTLVEEQQNELQTLLNSNAEEVSNANKRFYNDFAQTIQTRLDNNRMEIKQLIDQYSQSTRQQINDIKQVSQTHTDNLIKDIENAKVALSQQLKKQKKNSIALGFVIIVLALAAIIFHLY